VHLRVALVAKGLLALDAVDHAGGVVTHAARLSL
jgi:hypothetical protein